MRADTLGGFGVALKSEMKHFQHPETAESVFGRSRGSVDLSVNLDETPQDFFTEDVRSLASTVSPLRSCK